MAESGWLLSYAGEAYSGEIDNGRFSRTSPCSLLVSPRRSDVAPTRLGGDLPGIAANECAATGKILVKRFRIPS